MLAVIITFIFTLFVAYFATQNTQHVSVSVAGYHITAIPLYVVILIALLSGIFISWLFSMAGSISSFITIRGKDKVIKDKKRESTDLTKRVHQLELENEKLKTQLHISGDEKSI